MKLLRRLTLVAGIVSVAALAQEAESIEQKIAPELAAQTGDEVDVIVRFRDSSRGERRGGRGALVSARHRLRARAEHEFINSAAYTVSRSELARLAADPDVEYVSPDHEIHATLDRAKAAVTANTLINRTGLSGYGITVAVIDSGMENNEAFDNGVRRIIYQKSFVPNVTSTADEYGHGTHVASILGGDGSGINYNYAQYQGVAREVRFINLRVLDNNGAGKDSQVISALQWAVANRSYYRIRIINLSIGRPVSQSCKTDPLCQAVEAAWKAGIVVVVAAGNDGRVNSGGINGYGTINAPGNDPFVITVGAGKTNGTDSRADDMPATYSSKGPTMVDRIVKPDLLAPGNKIIALGSGKLLRDNPANVVDSNRYMHLSGTSMAAPVVSGPWLCCSNSSPGSHLTR